MKTFQSQLGIIACGLLVFVFSSCQNEPPVTEAPAGSLSTELIQNPRSLNKEVQSGKGLGHIVFTDTVHNFGVLKAGEVVTTEFTMTNTGNQDILIYDAKASCGCTVPEYPQTPLKPGKSDVIKVSFNSEGKTGYNDKSIVIHTNGNPAVYELRITAEVR